LASDSFVPESELLAGFHELRDWQARFLAALTS
jgi:hypothetical protein